MTLTKDQKGRYIKKRKSAAVEQALQFFNSNISYIQTDQKRNARKQIKSSGRPLRTAKALIKKYKNGKLSVCPDISSAQEARVTLIRRQHPLLQSIAAYEDELSALERALIADQISQENFDKKCLKIGEKGLPAWMISYVPSVLPPTILAIEHVSSDMLHKGLRLTNVHEPGEDISDVIGPIPNFLKRWR